MKGRCADEDHGRTRKTRFLNDGLSSYHSGCFAEPQHDKQLSNVVSILATDAIFG